jgi:serine protease Do
VNDDPRPSVPVARWPLLGAVFAAAIAGAFIGRIAFPQTQSSSNRPSRPIVQIVRQQAGLPDLSDIVDRFCPSVAVIVARGAAPSSTSPAGRQNPAFVVSADGWLVVASASLPSGPLDAIFGDGRRAALSEVRADPVSGLALIKTDAQTGPPLAFGDAALPRVGQFGLVLDTPIGRGCSAEVAMVDSDFLADGGETADYIRVQSHSDTWTSGLPFLATDGRLLGVSVPNPAGALLPAPVSAVVVDELIRNQLSPSTSFGFRAIDYGAAFSTRLGNLRSRAAVALVQAKSSTARAGLQAGDIVIAVNDLPVSSASELNRALDSTAETATLTVQRASEQLNFTIHRNTAS